MDMGMKAEMENIQELLSRLAATLGDSEGLDAARKGFEEADLPVSVEVAADTPEGLEEGLELASEVTPGLEGLEDVIGEDLDCDMEEGESHSPELTGLDAIGDEEELKKAVLARLMRK